jgi:hypothetical protein
LRDELNEPLGIGPDASPLTMRAGFSAFAIVAALTAAAIVAGELWLIRGAAPRAGDVFAASPAQRLTAPVEPPALRLSENSDPPSKPLPEPASADRVDQPGKAAELGLAKPARRPGAPEPLIIDVQQALAALRVKDPQGAQR